MSDAAGGVFGTLGVLTLFVLVPLAVKGALWLYRHDATYRKWADRTRQTRRGTVATATTGRVHLGGTAARMDRTLSSPILGKTCLAYSVKVVRVASGPELGQTIETTVHQDEASVPFWLTDQSGSAVVEPSERSTLELKEEPSIEHTSRKRAPAWLLERYESRGVNTEPDAACHRIRFIEGRLDEGETCGVLGEVMGTRGQAKMIGDGSAELLLTDGATDELVRKLGLRRGLALGAIVAAATMALGLVGVFLVAMLLSIL